MAFTKKDNLRPVPASAAVILAITAAILLAGTTAARNAHVINFKHQNLFPESFAWDPKHQHFIVGSMRRPTLLSVSDAGVAETLISDPELPPNSNILGVALDRRRRIVLACIHAATSPNFNGLAAYDLASGKRIFLTPLVGDPEFSKYRDVANDVAVDFAGNAYVTNSGADLIWKVNVDGEASILSNSKVFKSHPIDTTAFYHMCGLNGVVYNSHGYLLVVQSNTGKLYRVDAEDGSAKTVLLNKDLTAGDGLAVRRDGVLVVASQQKLFFVKSHDSWSEGVVFDETALDSDKQASSVAIGLDERVYALYGYVNEGMKRNVERDEFSIVEVVSEHENEDDHIWLYGLLGFGLAYFLFWRFQMKKLAAEMNKKRS